MTVLIVGRARPRQVQQPWRLGAPSCDNTFDLRGGPSGHALPTATYGQSKIQNRKSKISA